MQIDQFSNFLAQKCHLDPIKPVVAGVSGGPDSLCMLDMLLKAGMKVYVLHVNHQLRREAIEEQKLVESFCAHMNVKSVIKSADIGAIAAEQKISIEEAARKFRYKALFEYAQEIGAQAVLVAHNANDQAETVLMHLLRGSGMSGLMGMQMRTIHPMWSKQIPLVRPLLKISRGEILAYCDANNLTPVYDQSNQDTNYFRNRIRGELLPEMMTYNPRIIDLLTSLSDVISVDQSFLDEETVKAWQTCLTGEGQNFALLTISKLSALHPALLRRVLRKAIAQIEPDLRDIDFAATERAVTFLEINNRKSHVHLISTIEMVKHRHSELLICRQNDLLTELWPQIDLKMGFIINTNCEVDLGNHWIITCQESTQVPMFSKDGRSAVLDADLLFGLFLDKYQPGDRFKPYGLQGKEIKLGDFWTNIGLPERARSRWPLLRNGNGDIVWVVGTQISNRYKITTATKRILTLKLIKLSTEG